MMKYRNPQHLEDGRIDCEIEHPIFGWIPFTCDAKDKGATVCDARKLHEKMSKDARPYVPPAQAELDALGAAEVRQERAMLLSEVDAVVGNPLRWEEMSGDRRDAWRRYRRALLDVTKQKGFPRAVQWPQRP